MKHCAPCPNPSLDLTFLPPSSCERPPEYYLNGGDFATPSTDLMLAREVVLSWRPGAIDKVVPKQPGGGTPAYATFQVTRRGCVGLTEPREVFVKAMHRQVRAVATQRTMQLFAQEAAGARWAADLQAGPVLYHVDAQRGALLNAAINKAPIAFSASPVGAPRLGELSSSVLGSADLTPTLLSEVRKVHTAKLDTLPADCAGTLWLLREKRSLSRSLSQSYLTRSQQLQLLDADRLLGDTVQRLRQHNTHPDAPSVSPVHNDLYLDNTCYDATAKRLWLIDFADLHVGDPWRDIAHLMCMEDLAGAALPHLVRGDHFGPRNPLEGGALGQARDRTALHLAWCWLHTMAAIYDDAPQLADTCVPYSLSRPRQDWEIVAAVLRRQCNIR
jgi:hypothetical protein